MAQRWFRHALQIQQTVLNALQRLVLGQHHMQLKFQDDQTVCCVNGQYHLQRQWFHLWF